MVVSEAIYITCRSRSLNSARVGRVAYFHKIKDKKMAHIEWFEPASVVLGKRSQVSSQYELFAINNCTDVPIHTLDGSPLPFRQDGLVHYNEAFCNFLFTGSAFVRLASYDRLHVSGRCALCPIQAAGDDFPYHHGDIVLLSTGGDWEARISVIAQLIIRRRTRSFRKLIRRGADSCFGERLLELPQDVEELPLYDTDLVVGRCHIRVGTPTFDECVADPLLFFVNEFSSIVLCEQCLTGDDAARLEQERLDLMFVNHPHLKLKLLDAYCGAGGLSLGLEQGGRCIEPTLAFDHEPVAAQTYAKNTPTATVCVANSGSVLKTCVTGADGANVLGHRHIPKEIDIIAAGCPCQGHSGLNQHRGNLQATHNNLQVLTALSFVEHFKPRYFVFENVPGILGWNLPSQSADNNEGCRGLHLIIGVLLHLRYQVRTFKLLASQYGAPQKRQRLFIIAARMELPLPAAPHPLFSMPKGSEKMQTKHVKVCNAVSAEQPQWPVQSFDDLTPAHVPHAYYSLEAAIGDLHHFNWAKDEFADKAVITANRINRPTIYAPSAASVYPATTLKPLSEFQLRIRHSGHHDVPTISSLRHYTAGISQRSMNNVVAAVEGTSQRHYDRPRYDDQFRTLVTNFNPDALQVGVLHPTQTRIFTFRETLRGQGYPDWFSFPPDIRPRELYKLIGNSVPIPLGEAIGREIANSWINYLRSEGQIDLDGAEDSREGSVEAS
ncbi:S-adenosyl-L-methionine-dependent methyltransferase [Auriculariales sp. MPI-PUGE-AT-0066]|nr:S-adenosyl-L-methionine-dependent methyltransferase [Auriculariales sp. MPI-PUGE-AT-0066]